MLCSCSQAIVDLNEITICLRSLNWLKLSNSAKSEACASTRDVETVRIQGTHDAINVLDDLFEHHWVCQWEAESFVQDVEQNIVSHFEPMLLHMEFGSCVLVVMCACMKDARTRPRPWMLARVHIRNTSSYEQHNGKRQSKTVHMIITTHEKCDETRQDNDKKTANITGCGSEGLKVSSKMSNKTLPPSLSQCYYTLSSDRVFSWSCVRAWKTFACELAHEWSHVSKSQTLAAMSKTTAKVKAEQNTW